MSYKIDLSELHRDAPVSLTQQVVDRFTAAIEAGELDPGEKLPPTRELAELVGVNHLTAARVYRRLAELGYVTASVGRGTFVRSLAPARSEEHGDEWQVYALPEHELSYPEQVLADVMSNTGQPDLISLAVGWPSPRLYPTDELARITADVFAEEGGEALSYLPAEGLYAFREQLAARGRRCGFADDPDEIIVTSGAKQGISLAARATLEPGDVAVIESPTFAGMLDSLRQTGARVIGVPVDEDGFDVDALERLLARHEVKLVALQTACQNPTGRDLSEERRERLAALARERNFFVLEDRVYADARFEARAGASAARARARARDLRELAVEGGRRRSARRLGGGARPGARANRDAEARDRLPLAHADPAHRRALARDRRLRPPRGAHAALLPRAPRRAARGARAPPARRVPGRLAAGRPSRLGHAQPAARRARALHRGRAPRRRRSRRADAITAERRTQTSFRLSFSLLEPPELDEGVKRLTRAIREVRRRARHAVAAPMS